MTQSPDSFARVRHDVRPLAAGGSRSGVACATAAVRDGFEGARQTRRRSRSRARAALRSVVTDGRYRIAPRSPRRRRPARKRRRSATSSCPARSAASAAALELVGIFGVFACARRELRRVRSRRARARTWLAMNATATAAISSRDREQEQKRRNVGEHPTEPVDDAVQPIAEPVQLLAQRPRCRRRAELPRRTGCDAPSSRRVVGIYCRRYRSLPPVIGDRHLHVEGFVTDAQVEVERNHGGGDERRGDQTTRCVLTIPCAITSEVGLPPCAAHRLSPAASAMLSMRGQQRSRRGRRRARARNGIASARPSGPSPRTRLAVRGSPRGSRPRTAPPRRTSR